MKKNKKSADSKGRPVAISSTLPIEVLFAAGRPPLDLNNRFVTAPDSKSLRDPAALLALAAANGLPRTYCAWTRGVFAALLDGGPDTIVLVSGGDCTHSRIMGEKIRALGRAEVSNFSFPFVPDRVFLERETVRLAERFGTTLAAAEQVWRAFRPIRDALRDLDERTVDGGRVTGLENHLRLIAASDLGGDPARFHADLKRFLASADRRPRARGGARLGIVGIPPIFTDLHADLAARGASVVYNELAREFSMAEPADDLLDQYLKFTYPYALDLRLARIRREIERRRLDGIVHYTQTFCFHRSEHDYFAERLGVPVVLIEGHEPGPLDARTKTRLGAFLEGLKPRPRVASRPRVRAGIDIGSRGVKFAIAEGSGPARTFVRPTAEFYRAFLAAGAPAFTVGFLRGICPELPATARICATGYGRDHVRARGAARITEITAHALGAQAAFGLPEYTLVDIGGQDTKIIAVKGGRVIHFELNDRCAAGSGRFLENMAAIMGLAVGDLSAAAGEPEKLDATCATFGETELVGKILAGVPLSRLSAGVIQAVFDRLWPTVSRMARGALVLSGGGARCARLRDLFEARLDLPVVAVPDPEFNGARGCLAWFDRAD